MGMAAILVMLPGSFEQTFVSSSLRVSIWNLNLIGPVVSEKMFENVDGRMDARVTGIPLAHPWAFSLGELKICVFPVIRGKIGMVGRLLFYFFRPYRVSSLCVLSSLGTVKLVVQVEYLAHV